MSTKPKALEDLRLGYHWSYNLHQDPKRLGFVLARYQFAAQMSAPEAHVLELGCSEGIGIPLFHAAQSYTGVDLDRQAIAEAQANWGSERCQLIAEDFMGQEYGRFETLVSMDVVEHIYPEHEALYWRTVHQNLADHGVALIGTPNITSAPYASEASQKGHVNLYSAERLRARMLDICHNVFIFGLNDEMVHTGYHPMCHFLVALGCQRRNEAQI